MSLPVEKHRWAPQLRVYCETAVDSGRFVFDPMARVIWADWGLISSNCHARIELDITPDLTLTQALNRYYGGIRLCIALDERVLFVGLPTKRTFEHDARMNEGRLEAQVLRVDLRHEIELANQLEPALIHGSYSVAGRMAQGQNPTIASVTDFDGLPCIFNKDGQPNRAHQTLTVTTDGGRSREIPIFGFGNSTENVSWTLGDALIYLSYFHLPPLEHLNKFALIDLIRRAQSERQYDGGVRLVLQQSLFHEDIADRFCLEILREWLARFDLRLAGDAFLIDGNIKTRWELQTIDMGSVRRLPHRDAARDRHAAIQTEKKDVRFGDKVAAAGSHKLKIEVDEAAIRPVTLIQGAKRRYEIQVELVPGWLPEVGLDNTTAIDRTSAKSIALSDIDIASKGTALSDDEWYQRYHREGQSFSDHRDIARRWVLNESGKYPTALFARNAPFIDYSAFDFSSLLPGQWTQRRRRFLPLFDRRDSFPTGIEVEASFDGGTTWYILRDSFEVLSDECGIWFSTANPLNVTVPEAGNVNLWYALVDQTMRVRVRGVIESDECIGRRLANERTSTHPPTIAFEKDEMRFQFWGRTVGTPDRDDSALVNARGRTISHQTSKLAFIGELHYSWLETSLAPGDRVYGISGAIPDFSSARPTSLSSPIVDRMRFTNVANGYGTTVFLTG